MVDIVQCNQQVEDENKNLHTAHGWDENLLKRQSSLGCISKVIVLDIVHKVKSEYESNRRYDKSCPRVKAKEPKQLHLN